MPSTPAAKIRAWRTRIKGAWLIKVNDMKVSTIEEVSAIFKDLATSKAPSCTLLLSHSELKDGLVETSNPRVTLIS